MLIVDVGNSRIKWEFWKDGCTLAQGSADTRSAFRGQLDCEWVNLPKPRRILVANVAGEGIAERLTQWTMERWRVAPELATVSAAACGVRNGYDKPTQLGVDRWLGLIAVWHRYALPACLVDCGTAVTIDGLSPVGQHIGGLVLPGLSLMRHALAAHTDAIEEMQAGDTALLAHNTRDGVVAGTAHAIAACIDRVTNEVKRRFNKSQCIITGGDARLITPLLTDRFILIPNLVLQGVLIWGRCFQR
ncbi:MAG: type III pantothenate kinase [Gammaproteobacteria bacterium]